MKRKRRRYVKLIFCNRINIISVSRNFDILCKEMYNLFLFNGYFNFEYMLYNCKIELKIVRILNVSIKFQL